MEAVGTLLELQFSIAADQDDEADRFTASSRCQRVNDDLGPRRPGEPNRVEHISFGRESKVFGSIVRGVGVVKRSGRYFGWTFTIDPPRSSAIDRFPIHIQPRAHVEKNLLHFLRDGAVRAWADVEQQIAIFADDVDELIDHEFSRLERVVLNVAPGLIAYGSVGLPVEPTYVTKLSAFQVEHGGVLLHGVVLVVDDSNVVTVFERTVVIKSRKLR